MLNKIYKRFLISVIITFFAFPFIVMAAPFGPDTDLSLVDTIFQAEAAGDQCGNSVTALGDVNGDTIPDFAIGCLFNGYSDKNAGQVYIFFGTAAGWDPIVSLVDADASFVGERADSRAGIVASAGDVNFDGINDILIGAPKDAEAGSGAGQIYLILGKTTGWSRNTSLSTADASFLGENPEDAAGFSVASAGDVNNDTFDDFLISAPGNSDSDASAGQVYLILGKDSGWSMDLALSFADASFLGEDPGAETKSVDGVGDVNGDGFDDFLIGSWRRNSNDANAGEVYFFNGKASGWTMRVSLADADASFLGEGLGNWAGFSVAGAGDVNGDTLDDFLIGAPGDDDHGRQAGEAYLILGNETGWDKGTILDQADASFRSEWSWSWVGASVSGAGDINQDGFDDIMIGSSIDTDGGFNAGQVFIVLGRSTGWNQNMELRDAAGSYWGEEGGDNAGVSIAALGDVDNDGFDDLLIGAPHNDAIGNNAGQAYLLLGTDGPTANYFSVDKPFSGINNYHTISSSYYDLVDGWEDLKFVQMNISGKNKKGIVRYLPGKNRLLLYDKEIGWQSPCRRGQPTSLIGTWFELDCQFTSIVNEGDAELHIGWRIRITEPVTDPYSLSIDLRAFDFAHNDSGTIRGGNWEIDPNTNSQDLSEASHSFLGEADFDLAGWSVTFGDDLNNDGFGDLILGAPNNGSSFYNGGQVYVFFGNSTGWGIDISLANADASFVSEQKDDYAGWSVDGVGDVNNDGYDDIVIGAYSNAEIGITGGQVYLILGKEAGWTMNHPLDQSDASFLPEVGAGYVGYTVTKAGDVNNDGYKDFLIGSWGYKDGGGKKNAGKIYLILGKDVGWTMDTPLSLADAAYIGEDVDNWAGYSVSFAGDVNNDGFDDFLIGAPMNSEHGNHSGQAYLILGKDTGWTFNTYLDQADASFFGEAADDQAGMSLSYAGDVNNDGFADNLIDAFGNTEGRGRETGQVYLILGKESGWSMDTPLSLSDASYIGENAYDRAGNSLTSVGDVNNDTFDDFAIGAPGNDDAGSATGKVYIILGSDLGLVMDTPLATSYKSYWGEDIDDRAGYSIFGVTDVVGIGSKGLLIGAPGSDHSSIANVGKVYLVFP